MKTSWITWMGIFWLAASCSAQAATAKKPVVRSTGRAEIAVCVRDPYLGAIAVDAATDRVLFEDQADTRGYPASTLKLMDLLIILEKIESGGLKLTDRITATAAAAKMGGTQVFLKENEIFTVDELLYALMVQSANDAAVALATHIAGSPEAFVGLMNQRAQALGMTATVFHSVHGLPPGAGEEPDVSTPGDFARLALAVLRHKDTLRYTATAERVFRVQPALTIRTHNHLLENYRGQDRHNFPGCDGLKTGYIKAGGYGIAATAQRGGDRVLVVIFGSPSYAVRDAKARELLSQGLAAIAAYRAQHPAPPPPPMVPVALVPSSQAGPPASPAPPAKKHWWSW
ncbi:MAG: D-alanyl-D-alanine carboxypeptidase [Kiritimatiellaeota bacterium]|nr:D-alanyl-D-alanine carboxypeptidase [Kiritimatiellota bacterium]